MKTQVIIVCVALFLLLIFTLYLLNNAENRFANAAEVLCEAQLQMDDSNGKIAPFFIKHGKCQPNGWLCLDKEGDPETFDLDTEGVFETACYNKENCTASCQGICVNVQELIDSCKRRW